MPKALSIFAQWAPRYASLGFWPRPVAPGTKACRARRWTQPDKEIPPEVRKTRLKLQGQGIGLLMGSPFPDGTSLGALDIDHDNYTRDRPGAPSRSAVRPCGQEGRRVLRSGAWRSAQFRISSEGRQGRTLREGGRVPLHEEDVFDPSDPSPEHAAGIPLDRGAAARGRFSTLTDRGDLRCTTMPSSFR
jgi:hypothetical protein